jgi:predicted metal-dependent hydrolase
MEYVLKRYRRSRNIRIRVEPDGTVRVSAPMRALKGQIEQFVKASNDWIIRQQQRGKLKKELFPALDWERNQVSYKGKLYPFRLGNNRAEKITISDGVVWIQPVTGLEKDVSKTLLRWLKQESERYISDSVKVWSTAMGLTYKRVRFRQQKSRWGSCSSEGGLSFNWRLIHFAPEVIDYVVIHELAHLKHHNHSKQFWDLVKEHDPSYKQKVTFLKYQSIELE